MFLNASGLLIYFVFFSNVFSINNVKIIGLKRIPEITVKAEIDSILNEFKVLPINKNLIFFNVDQIKSIFLADINDIYITKNFFTKTLNVHVVEKQPIAQLIFNNETDSAFVDTNRSDVYLDDAGRIFKSELLRQEKFTKIIINQSQNNAPKSL